MAKGGAPGMQFHRVSVFLVIVVNKIPNNAWWEISQDDKRNFPATYSDALMMSCHRNESTTIL
jgi:hypothetical protein